GLVVMFVHSLPPEGLALSEGRALTSVRSGQATIRVTDNLPSCRGPGAHGQSDATAFARGPGAKPLLFRKDDFSSASTVPARDPGTGSGLGGALRAKNRTRGSGFGEGALLELLVGGSEYSRVNARPLQQAASSCLRLASRFLPLAE